MSVGVLIITHGEIGAQLVTTAESMLGGNTPLQCRSLSISQSCDPDAIVREGNKLVGELNNDCGVLILTDIYGSTPSNIANRLRGATELQVIAGVNLPMLIRILNYPSLRLQELAEKALSGGHDGIMLCIDTQ